MELVPIEPECLSFLALLVNCITSFQKFAYLKRLTFRKENSVFFFSYTDNMHRELVSLSFGIW